MRERIFERVRYELQQRPVEVSKIDKTSDGFISITFNGPDLGQFSSLSFDDHIKFIFENSRGETVRRDYTPRAFDASKQELVIEFALHEFGDASDWARLAKLGDRAIIGGPKGSRVIPMDFDWHLLIADSSSLPAVARSVEELSPESEVVIFIQVDHDNDQRDFGYLPKRTIRWFSSHQALIEHIKHFKLPKGEGFSWIAGEHTFALQARDILIDHGQSKDLMKAAAYWKKGAANFHERI